MLGLLKLQQIISKPAFILTIPSTPHPSPPNSFVPHPLAKTLGSPQLAKYARAGSCGFRLRRPRSIAIQEHHLRVKLAGTHQRSAHTVEVQAADRLHGLVCKHVSITPAAEYPITHFNVKRKPFWVWRDPVVPAGMIQICIGMDFTRDN